MPRCSELTNKQINLIYCKLSLLLVSKDIPANDSTQYLVKAPVCRGTVDERVAHQTSWTRYLRRQICIGQVLTATSSVHVLRTPLVAQFGGILPLPALKCPIPLLLLELS